MEQPHEQINNHDHVVVYIWRTTGGGGYGVGHVAANIHLAKFNQDTFVSLWPGYEAGETLTWQENFNEVYNTERDNAPNTILVFYTLNVLSALARFDTLKIQTEGWVMMPNKEESLDPESRCHNCCTAVWNVLKAGKVAGENGILTEDEFKSVLSNAKVNLIVQGSSHLPKSTSKFFVASSKSKDSRGTSNMASGTSTLTLEALLGGERYGPDVLHEILTKAKIREVEKMLKANPNDVRLKLQFAGHSALIGIKKDEGVMINANNVAAETEAFSAVTLSNPYKGAGKKP